MSDSATRDDLVAFRRDLHRHPEPGWCEFYTTARIVDELEKRPLDEVYVGPEVLAEGERMGLPNAETLDEWYEQAIEDEAREDIVERLEGGYTGAVAVYRNGEGPTVGLRVDIDALPIHESESDEHTPATDGFRSEHEGYMHACGHDAHATIGLGVLDRIVESDIEGTLKVFFQPSEELGSGGRPMAESGHLESVDYLLAVHVGLDHPTGEVVAGIGGFLAVSSFRAEFTGESSHAGGHPEEGRNAVQAMSTAVQNLYGIPRHSDGATRVNAGKVGGGTAANIIPEEAFVEAEVRGKTTDLLNYMYEKATRVVESAAEMHDCEVEMVRQSLAPSAESDGELVDIVAEVGGRTDGVENLIDRDELGGSEDATYLMQRVQRNGGYAAYVGVGANHPGGHHTSTFDVDDDALFVGIDVISDSLLEIAERRPELRA